MLILLEHFPWLKSETSDEQFDLMLSTLDCSVCRDKMKGICKGRGLRGKELRRCKLAMSLTYRAVSVEEWEKLYGVRYKPRD